LKLNSADRHTYLRAVEFLQPTGVELDIAAREYAEIHTLLAGRALPIEICRAQSGCPRHHAEVDCRLSRRIGVQRAHEGQPRDTIGYFNRWLILRGYLSKGTDWLEGVKEYSKQKLGEIEVLSADEMRRLIDAVDERILPLVVIGGFAGLRHEETKRLNWQDIDLDEGFIEIKASNSKTRTRRVVPIKNNLKAYLKPLAKKSGKVVTVENTTKQLLKAETETGDGWKRNALRHTYISARLAECGDEARVAYEAGNSPQVIRSNYDAKIRPKAAAEWFSIQP